MHKCAGSASKKLNGQECLTCLPSTVRAEDLPILRNLQTAPPPSPPQKIFHIVSHVHTWRLYKPALYYGHMRFQFVAFVIKRSHNRVEQKRFPMDSAIIQKADQLHPWLECLPRDGGIWQAEATAATRPRADLQFVFRRPPQEGLVAAHLLNHQDEELEHHDGKVAAMEG